MVLQLNTVGGEGGQRRRVAVGKVERLMSFCVERFSKCPGSSSNPARIHGPTPAACVGPCNWELGARSEEIGSSRARADHVTGGWRTCTCLWYGLRLAYIFIASPLAIWRSGTRDWRVPHCRPRGGSSSYLLKCKGGGHSFRGLTQ